VARRSSRKPPAIGLGIRCFPGTEEAATARHPQSIAELVAALRTENRDPDAHTIPHAAGERLENRQLAQLTDLLKVAGRTHDLRELQEGAAQRNTEN
jgi:hypothetical protein